MHLAWPGLAYPTGSGRDHKDHKLVRKQAPAPALAAREARPEHRGRCDTL